MKLPLLEIVVIEWDYVVIYRLANIGCQMVSFVPQSTQGPTPFGTTQGGYTMQQKKHIRKTVAILIATVMMLGVVLVPATAHAAITNGSDWNDPDVYDSTEDEPGTDDAVTNDAEDESAPVDVDGTADEPEVADQDDNGISVEPPGWTAVDANNFYLSGSLHSFQLISVEGSMALAIICQGEETGGFFATSTNFSDWEIRSPAAGWYVYFYGYYYWYMGGLHRTSDWQTHWQVYPVHDDYEWGSDLLYIIDSFYNANKLPHIGLTEGGILRIERLPYLIGDKIIWVGFAVIEDINGNIHRRQIRLFADGQWLNPLPAGATPALVGLEGVSWAREAIEFVVARDLMDMYVCLERNEPIVFHPTGNATRGDVLAAAVMALGLTPPDIPDIYHIPFVDVPLSGRGVYIDIAKQLGLVMGIGNNQFAPNRTISRQDMMTMLYNILLASGQITPDTGLTALRRFNDVGQIADYARLPISSLARAGIITGDGININPRGYMTRVEAAMFVWNLARIVV